MNLQDSWFMLGATNERWIPPERRLRPMSNYRQEERTHPIPYEWDAQPLHYLKVSAVAELCWQFQS